MSRGFLARKIRRKPGRPHIGARGKTLRLSFLLFFHLPPGLVFADKSTFVQRRTEMKGKEKRRTAAVISAAALILALAFSSCKTNADGGETPEPTPAPTPVTLSAKTDVSGVEGASLSDGVFTLSVGTGTDASLIAAFNLNNLLENGSGDRTFTVAETAELSKITGLSGWTGDASPYTIADGKLKGFVTAAAETSTEDIEILVSDSTTGENPLSLKVKIAVTKPLERLSRKSNVSGVQGASVSSNVYTLTAKTGTDVSTVAAFDLNNLLENGLGERTFTAQDISELSKVAGLSGWTGESSPYTIVGGKLSGTVTAESTTTTENITVFVSDQSTGQVPLRLTLRIKVAIPTLTGVRIDGGNTLIEQSGETTLSAEPQGELLEGAGISYKWEITSGSDLATLSPDGANATLKGKGDSTGGTVTVSVTASLGGQTSSATFDVRVLGDLGKSSVEINSIEKSVVSKALLELMDGGTLVVADTTTAEIPLDNGIKSALLNVKDKKVRLDLSGMTSLATLADSSSSSTGGVFKSCTALSEVVLPASLTKIGGYSFYQCSSLVKINIPDGVTEIKTYTFGYTGITDITIPKSVTYIGTHAFFSCESLKTVIIPEDSELKHIAQVAFSDCSSLSSIIFPNKLERIDQLAFSSTALKSITIPASVTLLYLTTFIDCSSLESVHFDAPSGWDKVKGDNVIESSVDFSDDTKNAEILKVYTGTGSSFNDYTRYKRAN